MRLHFSESVLFHSRNLLTDWLGIEFSTGRIFLRNRKDLIPLACSCLLVTILDPLHMTPFSFFLETRKTFSCPECSELSRKLGGSVIDYCASHLLYPFELET